MKIITGVFKNKTLYMPNKDNLKIRPISARLKESIYNLIQFDIKDKRVLDLFAGSGQLGIEAISRGAKHVLFIDHSSESINLIIKNTKFIGNKSLYKILKLEYSNFKKTIKNKFDIIFLDPPYYKNILNEFLIILSETNVFTKTSIIIFKNNINENIIIPTFFCIIKEKTYGNNKITIIAPKN